MRRSLVLTSSLSLMIVGVGIGVGGSGCIIVGGGSTSDTESSTKTSSSSGGVSSGSDSGMEGTLGTDGSGSATEGRTSSGGMTTISSSDATDAGTDTTEATTGVETTGGGSCEEGCAENEYCDWAANSCGTSRADVGTCTPRPDACDASYEPVCGCDGESHSNECGAYSAGTDVAGDGGCLPLEEYFACGWRYCQEGLEYCQISYSDVPGFPDLYSCKPLPEACGKELVCDCLDGEPCFEWECTEEGGLTLYCPGG